MSRYEYVYPAKLSPGDKIGVVAPASPFDRMLFNKGVAVLESMGFDLVVPDEIYDEDRFLAGPDEMRAELIHRFFSDDGIRGIVCARGGYGSMRLLHHLDFEMIRANPKLVVGFSDITALLSALSAQSGLICWHGPVLTSLANAGEASLNSIKHVLTGDWCGEITADDGTVVFPGRVRGRLAGGNLTTLCHLVGTEFAPEFSGCILMLEDIGERPYRIDRMLTQMKLAGLFDGVSGVVAGSFDNCGCIDDVNHIFSSVFCEYDIPVVSGFPFGHTEPNLTFPIGGAAELDASCLRVAYGIE